MSGFGRGQTLGFVKRKIQTGKAGTALSALPVALGQGDAPPTEFRVFKAGENPSEKGTFIFDDASALSVMEEFKQHGKPMLLDFNHGTLVEGAAPEASISAGEGMPEIRNGELWLRDIKWTQRADAMLRAKEYRLFSPYFNHDKDNHVTRLINVALTNLPALDNIQPLVAASANPNNEDDMATECTACAALNAKLSAMDEECKSLKAKLSAFEKKDADDSTKATALSALTGKTVHAETLGVIQGWKAKAEQHDVLAAKLAEQEATALSAELTAALDSDPARVPGKPGEKGTVRATLETQALTLGGGKPSKEGVAFLKALIPGLPKQVPTGEHQAPAGGPPNPSITEAKMNRAMGVDGAAFAKWQADQAAARG